MPRKSAKNGQDAPDEALSADTGIMVPAGDLVNIIKFIGDLTHHILEKSGHSQNIPDPGVWNETDISREDLVYLVGAHARQFVFLRRGLLEIEPSSASGKQRRESLIKAINSCRDNDGQITPQGGDSRGPDRPSAAD